MRSVASEMGVGLATVQRWVAHAGVARLFDMYLTSMLFQGLFAVLVIGLLILFQDDIRRALQTRPVLEVAATRLAARL